MMIIEVVNDKNNSNSENVRISKKPIVTVKITFHTRKAWTQEKQNKY